MTEYDYNHPLSIYVFVCMHVQMCVCITICIYVSICVYVYVFFSLFSPSLAALTVSLFLSQPSSPSFFPTLRSYTLDCTH